MDRRRLDLGPVQSITGEAFGEPGHRRFRLHAVNAEGTLSLWIEKQHVVLLAEAIRQILMTTPRREAAAASSGALHGDFEVSVGSLQLGYDPATARYVIEAGDFETVFDLEAVSVQGDRSQMERLLADLEAIVAASRPRCTMCGAPLGDEPHFCPESNGHAHVRDA